MRQLWQKYLKLLIAHQKWNLKQWDKKNLITFHKLQVAQIVRNNYLFLASNNTNCELVQLVAIYYLLSLKN